MNSNCFDIINNDNIKILNGYEKFFITINKDTNKYLFNKHDDVNNYVKSSSFNKVPVKIRFNEDDIVYRVQNGAYISATKGAEISIGEYAVGSKVIITYKKNSSYTTYTETIEVINSSVYDLGVNNSGAYNEVNDTSNPYKLSVTCNKKSFTKTGGTGTISITSNTTWNITNKPDWVSISVELSGEGNKSITFTIGSNSSSNRSGNIVIYSALANKTYTISLSQQGESTSGGQNNTNTDYPSGYTYKLVVYPESTTIKTNNNGEQSIVGLIQGFSNNELVLQKDVTNSMILKDKTGDTAIFKSYANGLMKYDKNVPTSSNINQDDLYLLRIDNVVISGVPDTIYEENISNDDTYSISGDVYLYKRINSTQMIASSDWTKLTIDGTYTGGIKTVSGKSYHFNVNLKLTDLVTYNFMKVWTTINGVTYSKSVAPLVSYDRIKYPIYYGKLNASDGFIKVTYPDTDHERHELRLYKHVDINNLSAKFNKVYVTRAKNAKETSFSININGNINNPFVFLYNTNHIYYYSVNAVDPSTNQSITATGEYHQMESENNMLIHRAAVYCEADSFYALADPIQSKITDMQTTVNGTYTVYVKTEAFNYVGSNNNNNDLSSYPELVTENNNSSTTILPGNHNFNLTFSIKINNREYTDSSAFNIITSDSNIDNIVSLSFTRPTSKLAVTGSLPKFMGFELEGGTNITNNYIIGKDVDNANAIITSQEITGDGYKKINYSNKTPFDIPLIVQCYYVWTNGTRYDKYEYFVIPTDIVQGSNAKRYIANGIYGTPGDTNITITKGVDQTFTVEFSSEMNNLWGAYWEIPSGGPLYWRSHPEFGQTSVTVYANSTGSGSITLKIRDKATQSEDLKWATWNVTITEAQSGNNTIYDTSNVVAYNNTGAKTIILNSHSASVVPGGPNLYIKKGNTLSIEVRNLLSNEIPIWKINSSNIGWSSTPLSGDTLVTIKGNSNGEGKLTLIIRDADYLTDETGAHDFKTYAMNVSVRENIVLSNKVTITPSELNLKKGETAQIYATVTPSNITFPGYTWSTPQGAVTTVSKTGMVTAVRTGTSRIIAEAADGNSSAWITVKVTEE